MFKPKDQAAKSDGIQHLLPFLFVRFVWSPPVLIDPIRLLSHALWLSKIFYHVWVIVDLLYSIARVCSKSCYLRSVEICRWNYWTASPCSLPVLLLHVWVIIDILFPVARDCSKSTYLRFVEIKVWNYYIAYSSYLAFHIFVACLGDYGLGVIVHVLH
jgi:hypothetical protein